MSNKSEARRDPGSKGIPLLSRSCYFRSRPSDVQRILSMLGMLQLGIDVTWKAELDTTSSGQTTKQLLLHTPHSDALNPVSTWDGDEIRCYVNVRGMFRQSAGRTKSSKMVPLFPRSSVWFTVERRPELFRFCELCRHMLYGYSIIRTTWAHAGTDKNGECNQRLLPPCSVPKQTWKVLFSSLTDFNGVT